MGCIHGFNDTKDCDKCRKLLSEVPNIVPTSLRDWFAGMALQGLLSSGALNNLKDYAPTAYEIADAMMERRGSEGN